MAVTFNYQNSSWTGQTSLKTYCNKLEELAGDLTTKAQTDPAFFSSEAGRVNLAEIYAQVFSSFQQTRFSQGLVGQHDPELVENVSNAYKAVIEKMVFVSGGDPGWAQVRVISLLKGSIWRENLPFTEIEETLKDLNKAAKLINEQRISKFESIEGIEKIKILYSRIFKRLEEIEEVDNNSQLLEVEHRLSRLINNPSRWKNIQKPLFWKRIQWKDANDLGGKAEALKQICEELEQLKESMGPVCPVDEEEARISWVASLYQEIFNSIQNENNRLVKKKFSKVKKVLVKIVGGKLRWPEVELAVIAEQIKWSQQSDYEGFSERVKLFLILLEKAKKLYPDTFITLKNIKSLALVYEEILENYQKINEELLQKGLIENHPIHQLLFDTIENIKNLLGQSQYALLCMCLLQNESLLKIGETFDQKEAARINGYLEAVATSNLSLGSHENTVRMAKLYKTIKQSFEKKPQLQNLPELFNSISENLKKIVGYPKGWRQIQEHLLWESLKWKVSCDEASERVLIEELLSKVNRFEDEELVLIRSLSGLDKAACFYADLVAVFKKNQEIIEDLKKEIVIFVAKSFGYELLNLYTHYKELVVERAQSNLTKEMDERLERIERLLGLVVAYVIDEVKRPKNPNGYLWRIKKIDGACHYLLGTIDYVTEAMRGAKTILYAKERAKRVMAFMRPLKEGRDPDSSLNTHMLGWAQRSGIALESIEIGEGSRSFLFKGEDAEKKNSMYRNPAKLTGAEIRWKNLSRVEKKFDQLLIKRFKLAAPREEISVSNSPVVEAVNQIVSGVYTLLTYPFFSYYQPIPLVEEIDGAILIALEQQRWNTGSEELSLFSLGGESFQEDLAVFGTKMLNALREEQEGLLVTAPAACVMDSLLEIVGELYEIEKAVLINGEVVFAPLPKIKEPKAPFVVDLYSESYEKEVISSLLEELVSALEESEEKPLVKGAEKLERDLVEAFADAQ